MPSSRPTRLLLILTLSISAAAQSRPISNLPANPATTTPAPQVFPISATPTQPDANTRARRAEVTYTSGLLSINASNSSLNSILREIAKQTGMKITGGVREERVFGHYGPASPSVILATLIGGTGTNMLLRQADANSPAELILTPRGGGPTPPNPNAAGFDDEGRDDQDQQPPRQIVQTPQPQQNQAPQTNLQPNPGSVPNSIPQPANNVLGDPNNVTPTASTFPTTNSVPTDSLPTPSTTVQTMPGIVDTPNPAINAIAPATPTPDAASPNGVKTPEQIYQQLQQLRQQQQKTAAPQ